MITDREKIMKNQKSKLILLLSVILAGVVLVAVVQFIRNSSAAKAATTAAKTFLEEMDDIYLLPEDVRTPTSDVSDEVIARIQQDIDAAYEKFADPESAHMKEWKDLEYTLAKNQKDKTRRGFRDNYTVVRVLKSKADKTHATVQLLCRIDNESADSGKRSLKYHYTISLRKINGSWRVARMLGEPLGFWNEP